MLSTTCPMKIRQQVPANATASFSSNSFFKPASLIQSRAFIIPWAETKAGCIKCSNGRHFSSSFPVPMKNLESGEPSFSAKEQSNTDVQRVEFSRNHLIPDTSRTYRVETNWQDESMNFGVGFGVRKDINCEEPEEFKHEVKSSEEKEQIESNGVQGNKIQQDLENLAVELLAKRNHLKGINYEALRRKDLVRNISKLERVSMGNIVLQGSQEVQGCNLPPLVSALKAAAMENAASFHFPGHNRGHAAPSSLTQIIGQKPFLHDLPDLPELDNLFAPEGPILEAQKMAAELFGASETWFLVGGSTCGIQAAVMATCSPGDIVILPRNSHISATSAMVLSGALPKYILPDYNYDWDISGGVTPSQVEKAFKELEVEGRKAAAVFIVSPTYHGICSDVATISQLCHSRNIPLIVDEAHGAHFGFHELLPSSALYQGADIAIQSTHKVLSSFTQSSMLHRLGNLVNRDRICQCLQTLQTSSPSYLLLASLDAARAQLSENHETIFDRAMEFAMHTRSEVSTLPNISILDKTAFSDFPDIDPLRITIGTRQLGLSGFEADDILSKDYGIVAELVGTQSITLAFNIGTQWDHVIRLISGMNHLSAKSAPTTKCNKGKGNGNDSIHIVPFGNFSMSLSPRDAFFAPKVKVNIKESTGCVCGELVCPYPPGIPVLVPGEIVTDSAIDYLLQIKDKGAIISGTSDHLLSSLLVCDL